VIAIVVEAVLRIGKRTLNHSLLVVFAVLAFVALYFLSVPFPLVVVAAAFGGLLLSRVVPEAVAGGGHGATVEEEGEAVIDQAPTKSRPSVLRNLRLLAVFLVLWAVPVGALWLWRGSEDVLIKEALFFTGAAFVTFGGAYAVLSYISDVAVSQYGWLTADQMVQGLGLAESTPGPLIMVTQYVGFFGAWNDPGSFSPLLYGTLGAAITTYATFLPCFLFIFLLAPYIELLANNRRLRAVLVGVTAAIVGVVANLAVFFASRVLFPDGLSLAGIDLFALAVAIVSFAVLQRYKPPIYLMVPVGALLGMVWTVALG
jgi:chromate transporter